MPAEGPTGAEHRELVERARGLGATDEELAGAVNVGELVLDLVMRPRSGRTVGDVIAERGADERLTLRLLEATGLPTSLDAPVSDAEAATIALLLTVATEVLDEETTVQLCRVTGLAIARIAEALVTAFRLQVEIPQRNAGVSYVKTVDGYVDAVQTVLPSFVGSLDVLLRQHILAVAGRMWSTDEEDAAVTLPRAVGFADLVGYTSAASTMSVRELTATLVDFDHHTADAALRLGGQIVKTIGDEVMFVAEDPVVAARIGLEILDAFGGAGGPRVRVGIAAGDVVSVFGDYYGTQVNLAARLVGAAGPGEVLVSAPVADACAGTLGVEPVGALPLKGFDGPVPAFRLRSRGR